MKRLSLVVAALVVAGATVGTLAMTSGAAPDGITNLVASSPTTGGGYPVPTGSRVPEAGTCRTGPFDANHSESWLAVKPGTEDLVGSSKFFFDKYSTFYMFYLGAYQILGGTPSGNNQIQGYDCISTGTQEMPPSWTDTTDPNVDFDTQGRVYQTILPFNSFFDATKLHPDGEIDVSYSDFPWRDWVKGNGGRPLEPPNNASAKQAGHVEDKQWIAVNHIPGNRFHDHVYAAWSVFNGNGGGIKVRMAVSRDRGQTFAKAVTISTPSEVSAGVTYVYPEIDAVGDVYVSLVSFPPNGGASTIYVARSSDDGRTFGPWVPVTTVNMIPTAGLPNTRFRDGITESFAASQTFPGHLYLTYEDWDPLAGQMDVKFTQSTDGGSTWTTPVVVNDNFDLAGAATDQFQPPPRRPGRLRRTARWRWPSMTVAGRAPTTRASSPPTSGGRTSASIPRCRPTRTAATVRCRSARTCGSRISPGIQSSQASTAAASRSIHAPGREIPARPAEDSSATTLALRSRVGISTRSSSLRTTPRT